MPADPTMPRYRSHKTVQAVKISAIEFAPDGSARIATAEPGHEAISAKPGYRDRFKGDDDDLGYFVVYADGYQSWSPTKAFEEGYTRIAEPALGEPSRDERSQSSLCP